MGARHLPVLIFFFKCRLGCLSAGFGVLSAGFTEKEGKKRRKKLRIQDPLFGVPVRLRVQSPSRTLLRIAASIACFTLVFKGFLDTIALLRGCEPPKRFRMRQLRTPTCVCGCEIGPPNRTPSLIQPVEGATKEMRREQRFN